MATVTAGQIPQLIANTASQYGVSPQLALEVAIQESGLNQSARSSAGAIGIFQLEPATAAGLGVDPTDATQNIQGGVRYLAQLLSQFGDTATALAAYDWGPGNVSAAIAQYGSGWLSHAPAETQNYVKSIMAGIGQNYQITATPASVASGTVDALTGDISDTTNQASMGDITINTPLLLTVGAIGVFLLFDFFTDDE